MRLGHELLRGRISIVLFAALASGPATATTVRAQTYTWNGGSGISNNWNDPLNWTSVFAPPTAPPAPFGTDLNFAFTGAKSTSVIDADWTVTQMEFVSGVTAMTFTGEALTVQQHGIFNNDNSTHTFSNEEIRFRTIGVAGGLDLSVLATSGNLDFNARIVVSEGLELNVGGANDVFFDGGIIRSASTAAVMVLNKNGAGELRLREDSTGIEELNISGGSVLLSQTNNPTLDSNLAVTVFSGALFDLNGNNVNLNTLSGSGKVSLGSGTLTLGDSTSFTFDGEISEAGGLTKEGSGILTLEGINTYTGATSITGGTLRLGTGGSLSSGTDVSVSSGATFDLNGISDSVDSIAGAGAILLGGATLGVDEATGTRTFSGNIQESGTLAKAGGGTLALSGTNTMTSFQIGGGVVQFNNAAALGSSVSLANNATLQSTATLTSSVPISIISSGGTINVSNATTLTQSGLISGAGALNKQGDGTLVLGAGNSYTGDTNILDGNLRLGSSDRINNSSDVTLVAKGTLELNNFTDTVSSLAGTGGSISTGGSGGRLTVNAASGAFTWNGNISGTGGFTKSGNHTMVIAAAQTYTGSTVINDGLLQFSGSGSFSNGSDISVASGATWDLNGISDSVDSISGAGNISLGGALLTVDEDGGSRTFSGNITGSGSLNKSGSHTLVLSGNNAFDGELSISGGTLQVGASNNLGGAASTLVFFGGTLQTTSTFTSSRSVVIGPSNSATFHVDPSTTLTQSGLITGDTTTTINKSGSGSFLLNSASSGFGGSININEGTFQFGSGDTVANSTNVNVSSGAIFSLTQTEGIDALSGAGDVIIASGQLLQGGLDNSSSTFSGVISGTNGLFSKAGAGVLTLAGSNTYTGATSITGGTLRLSGSGQLADQTDVDISAGATFDLNNISDAIDSLTGAGSVTIGTGFSVKMLTIGSNAGGGTFSGNISGTFGNLVKTGAGTQVLSGNNTYSGTTSFNGGVLSTASSSNLGSGQLIFNGGTWQVTGSLSNSRSILIGLGGAGTIDVDTGVTLTQGGTINGSLATLNKNSAGTMLLTASATPATMNINGGLLQFLGSGSLASSTNVNIASGATWNLNGLDDTVATISGAGSIQLNSFAELTVRANSPDAAFSGVISGNGLFIKDGNHSLTLSGINTYSAGTRINGGTLAITSDANLGNAGSPVLMDGGTLETANSMTINRNFLLNSEGGTIALEGGLNSTTLPGLIDGTGALTKRGGAGLGALILTGNNTYSGGTIVETGVVTVSTNANLGSNAGGVTLVNGSVLNSVGTFLNLHAIEIDNGGGIAVAGGQTLTQAVGISGTGTFTKSGAGTLLLTAAATHAGDTIITAGTLQFGSGELPDAFDVTVDGVGDVWDLNGVSDTIDGLFGAGTVLLGGGTLTVGSADGNGNLSGLIQGSGAVVKTGNGVQILSGANAYTASTTIDEGTLEIVDNSSLGAVSANLIFNDGTLRSTSSFSTGRTTTINSSGTFDLAPGTTLTFTRPIGGMGELRKSNTGILELTQANTYAGLTQIDEGTLRLSGGGLLADTTDVFVEVGATFDATEIVDSIDSLTGGGNVLLGLGALTIGSNDGGGKFSGVISGVGGALVKEGAGTEVFSGINNYTGGTFINGGVLQVSQSENLGALGTLLSIDGGTLHATASFGMIRGISLGAGENAFDVDLGTTLNASGNITGVGGSLTKIGGGTLALSGLSTYDGGTFIYGGIVEIGDANDLGNTAGPLTIDGGTLRTVATITTARATIIGPGAASIETSPLTTLILTGPISGNAGAAGFTKAGDGTLRLQSANSFSAAIRLAGGLLQVSASNQLGNEGNSIDLVGGSLNTLTSFTNPRTVRIGVGGGGIDVATGATFTQSGVIQDDLTGPVDGLAKNGSGVLLTTAANTYTGPTVINSGALRLLGAGRLPDVTDVTVAANGLFDLNNVSDAIDSLSGTGDITLGSGFLTIGADDGGATYAGTIIGTGGLIKTGAGTQLIRTKMVGMDTFPNTYTGGTAINGGVLDVEDNASLGNPSGPLSFNGGTLQVQGDNRVDSARAVTLNAGGGAVNTSGEDASVTFSGVAAGPGFLRKNGSGTLTLSAANTYTGDTIINGGITRLQDAGRLPDASTVTVDASGLEGQGLNLNNISDAINGLDGNGNIYLGSGTLTVGSAGGGGDFGGVIDGTGGFAKVGAGAQILAGANTYSGGTSINGGVLEINVNSNLGASTGPLSFNGGTLIVTGAFAMSRLTTMNVGGGTFDVTGANTLTHSSSISGVGGLSKTNSGTLLLNGANSFTGPTNIAGGTLRLGGVERLDNMTDVSVSAGAIWDLNSFNETVDSLSGAGSVQLGGAQLVVGFDNGSGAFSGVLSGSGDLLKEGTGTQILSGVNTYSGATFVDRGELILTGGGSISQATLVTGFNIGSDGATTVEGPNTTWDLTGNLLVGFDGAGQLHINDGATITVEGDVIIGGNGIPGTLRLDDGTLDNSAGNGVVVTSGALAGHGTVIGDVFNQDTVSPGNSAGILELMGSYIQDISGTLSIEVGGAINTNPSNPQFDVLEVSGTASLGGQLQLALINGFTPAASDAFEIFSAASLSGVFSNVADGARLNISGGGAGSFLVDYTASSIILSDFVGTGTGLLGDFDFDGDVDGRDFLIWQQGGSPNPLSSGDLADWQANFGAGTLVAAGTVAPEPNTAILLLAGMMVVRSCRRCRAASIR